MSAGFQFNYLNILPYRGIIIQRFLEASKFWIPCISQNPRDCGAAGATFESLFDLKRNTKPLADYHSFEFKTKKNFSIEQYVDAKYDMEILENVTLFNFVSTKQIVRDIYPEKCTMEIDSHSYKRNALGTYLEKTEKNKYLIYELKQEFEKKLRFMIYVNYETTNKIYNNRPTKMIHFCTMKLYSDTNFDTFLDLLKDKTIFIVKNSFKIHPENLDRLYKNEDEVNGTALPNDQYYKYYGESNTFQNNTLNGKAINESSLLKGNFASFNGVPL